MTVDQTQLLAELERLSHRLKTAEAFLLRTESCVYALRDDVERMIANNITNETAALEHSSNAANKNGTLPDVPPLTH